jgi:hypothetical protein
VHALAGPSRGEVCAASKEVGHLQSHKQIVSPSSPFDYPNSSFSAGAFH